MNDNLNNPRRPIGTYVPGENPAIGSYSREVSDLSDIAHSSAFATIQESLLSDGGVILSFNRVKDKQTINTNFAFNFTSQVRSFIASLESKNATSSQLDQIRLDIDLLNQLLADHIDEQEATPDMIASIDSFITSNLDELSPIAMFKLRSIAVSSIYAAFRTVNNANINNSFEYLSNLPEENQTTINNFLASVGLQPFDSMSNAPELINAITSIVVGAGTDSLEEIGEDVIKMFSEQDPEYAQRSRKFNDALSAIELKLREFGNETEAAKQQALLQELSVSVAALNAEFSTTLQVEDLLNTNSNTAIIDTEITVEKALELNPDYTEVNLQTLYDKLKKVLADNPINQTELAKVVQTLENLSNKFNKDLYFSETIALKQTLPTSLYAVLGIKNHKDQEIDKLKEEALPDAFKNMSEVRQAVVKLKSHYNIDATVQNLLNGLDITKYDRDQVDFESLIGLKPGTSYSDAVNTFDKVKNTTDFTPDNFRSNLSSLNQLLQKDLAEDLFVDKVMQNTTDLPDNHLKILGVNVADRNELVIKVLAFGQDESVDEYLARCKSYGVNFDKATISLPSIVLDPLHELKRDGLEDKPVTKLNPDQLTIALMGLHSATHALNLDNPVKLSPEATLKAGVINLVQEKTRSKMDQIRQQFRTSKLNLDEVRLSQGDLAADTLQSEYYSLDYKEAMLSLALDLSVLSPSVNSSLRKNLEMLSDDYSTDDFESICANMTDQQLLTVSAELNSFAEGNRRSSKHDNRKIIFKSDQDVAKVRRFSELAIDFIQKRTTTKMLQDIDLSSPDSTRVSKLRQLSAITNSRMKRLTSIVDKAYLGATKPASYRFMLGVRQELDDIRKEIRGFELPWSLKRSFSSGYSNYKKLREEASARGLAPLMKHMNYTTIYGDVMTQVSDMATSPIWFTRKIFRPSITKIVNATQKTWNVGRTLVSTPFNFAKKTYDAAAYSAGWLVGLPIRIPVNAAKGIWNGALGA